MRGQHVNSYLCYEFKSCEILPPSTISGLKILTSTLGCHCELLFCSLDFLNSSRNFNPSKYSLKPHGKQTFKVVVVTGQLVSRVRTLTAVLLQLAT